MALKEMGWEDMAWIHLVQDRGKWETLVNKVINMQGTSDQLRNY
jgi:hypothetical protein